MSADREFRDDEMSLDEIDRRLASLESTAEPFGEERIAEMVAEVRELRARSRRRVMRWAALWLVLVMLLSAGVATVIWPSHHNATENVSYSESLELMRNDSETTYRREIGIACVAQFALSGFRTCNELVVEGDSDVSSAARRHLQYLDRVWDGAVVPPKPDMSIDFREAARTLEEGGPDSARAFAALISQAAYALYELKSLPLSDPELVELRRRRVVMIEGWKGR